MISRLAFSGIRRQPLASLASVFFIAASTTLLALTALLSCQLYGSIDSLMDQAQVPDILQMHAGSVDEQDIKDFADRCPQIAGWQISSFLNLNNPAVRLKDQSLAGRTTDLSFSRNTLISFWTCQAASRRSSLEKCMCPWPTAACTI